MWSEPSSRGVRAWTVALVLSVTATARAQESTEEIARRELLTRAETAVERGEHASALDLAQRAGRIRMTTSLRLMIAQEHHALGHTLDALASASACESEATANPSLNNRQRILDACSALATMLRGAVGRVIVRAPSPAPSGLRLQVGGEALPESLWGEQYPVRPGSVRVVGLLGGEPVFQREVVVNAGSEVTVEITLPREERTVREPEATVSEPPSAVATLVRSAPSRPPIPTQRSRGGSGAGPWVVAGVGAALAAFGGVMWVLRNNAVGNCSVGDDAITCDSPEDVERARGAAGLGLAANVSIGVGLAALTAGAVWYAVGRVTERRASVTVSVVPTASGASLSWGGRF